ncbi:MAG TPA: hypothetical protein VFT98_00520 [Myxococcota bacterium]|nr:hypothetical protein [Myxococcota bacterium]
MADTEAFDFVCGELEARTSLDRLAARGTVRIALKQAGLDSRSATPEQMAVVVEKLLTTELANRGIADAVSLCAQIAQKARRLQGAAGPETPDAVFRRLGG